MTLSSSRRPLKIYQDDKTTSDTLDTAIRAHSVVPLAARTRSMTRLSSVASSKTSNSRIARLDRATAKREDKENVQGASATVKRGVKRTLNETMIDSTKHSRGTMEGMKRKDLAKPEIGAKKQKTIEGTLRTLPVNRAFGPVTPERKQQGGQPRPTPARVILQAQAEEDDMSEEDESLSDSSSRFVARPPTPPRPHVSLSAEVQAQGASSMDIDCPERSHGTVKACTTPMQSPLIKRTAAPVTPRSTAITPKRVMGSISKFRSGPSSARKQIVSTIKLPQSGGNMLATLLQAPEGDESVYKSPLEEMSVEGQALSVADSESLVEEAVLNMSMVDQVDTPASALPNESARPSTSASLSIVVDEQPARVPLSRLPRSTVAPPPRARETGVTNLERPKQSSLPVMSKSVSSASSLGRGLPLSAPSTSPVTDPGPTRRKPSYPSSLGSGPLARPRDRMVSGPTLYTQRDGTLSTKKGEPMQTKWQSSRSVSEPSNRPRPSLSASTSRREGLSVETSKSLAGLADALKTLRMKKADEPKLAERPVAQIAKPSQVTPAATTTYTPAAPSLASSTSLRMTGVHRPRNSVLPPAVDDSMSSEEGDHPIDHPGDKSLAAIMSSSTGGGCLRGVVAFVDVKTADGEDASTIFSDMLRALGAKVLSRLTENVTHIVYKSGKPTTLTWYRKQDEDERPYVVGISWVTRSKERGERLDETSFLVEVAEEDVFQKRRKSMEPKALMQSTLTASCIVNGTLSLANIKRQSMMYAPKISSPLKKAFRVREEED